MSAEVAVAKLNRMGGKGTPAANTRFRARVSGIFSPEKQQPVDAEEQPTRRASGKLQRKRLSQPGPSINRRNSFSPPDGNDQDLSSPPKPKKKAIVRIKKKADNQSPLKKHGYNVQLQETPNVNLNDSPAKNTRAKTANPLATLAEANLPDPQTMVTRSKGQTQEGQDPSSTMETPGSNRRKRKATQMTEQGETPRQDIRDPKRGRLGDNDEEQPTQEGDEFHDAEQQQSEGGDGEGTADQAEKSTQPARKRGRPRKNANTGEPKPSQSTQNSSATQARVLAQAQEVNEEEAKRFQECRKEFAKEITDVVQINDCEKPWMDLGAAAYMIKDKTASNKPESAESKRGSAVLRTIQSISKTYKKVRSNRTLSSADQETIVELLTKLEGRCNLLASTQSLADNRKIIRDMFLRVIPQLCFLLRRFLLRCNDQYLLEPQMLNELIRLLRLTEKVCKGAQEWTPKPSTLDSGVRKWVNQNIMPNIRLLLSHFLPDEKRYRRISDDRRIIDELARRQVAALKAQSRKVEMVKAERRQRWDSTHPPTVQVPNSTTHIRFPVKRQIYDIDDARSESAELPHVAGNTTELERLETSERRPRLIREHTADLPPPLSISLSEDEKMALLNGLQKYRGKDRYAEILGDQNLGNALRNRDLDDLVKAARSFSQIMASKMGREEYLADQSLEWLSSTDPEAERRR